MEAYLVSITTNSGAEIGDRTQLLRAYWGS
jgi:putative Ca2+/H+ antiporter (TMEM165/GDT1 family)